jgi:hypothetical protein
MARQKTTIKKQEIYKFKIVAINKSEIEIPKSEIQVCASTIISMNSLG